MKQVESNYIFDDGTSARSITRITEYKNRFLYSTVIKFPDSTIKKSTSIHFEDALGWAHSEIKYYERTKLR